MGKPHKHAELIKAWADGAVIQCQQRTNGEWSDLITPTWSTTCDYRIKPEPKPDCRLQLLLQRMDNGNAVICNFSTIYNINATFDGETGKLKKVEMIDD